uniref:Bromo domain-containing protein n=1 Tax=Ciona savignyi TaxID=51511 RepID=H2YZJ7_CIOSA
MLCRDLDTALEQEATTSKRKRYTGLQGKNLKLCERILLELFCFKQSTPFHFPVKTSVPNYYKIIKEPMDFLKIKKKLLHAHFSHYEDCEAFISDVLLVFTNCYLFNGEQTVLGTMGREVQQFFCERVHAWLPHMKDNLANLIEEQKQTLADSHVKPVLNTAEQSKHVEKQKPLPYEHDDLWKPDIDEPDDDDDVIGSATTSDGVSEEHSDTTDDSRRRKQSKSGIVHIQ